MGCRKEGKKWTYLTFKSYCPRFSGESVLKNTSKTGDFSKCIRKEKTHDYLRYKAVCAGAVRSHRRGS